MSQLHIAPLMEPSLCFWDDMVNAGIIITSNKFAIYYCVVGWIHRQSTDLADAFVSFHQLLPSYIMVNSDPIIISQSLPPFI